MMESENAVDKVDLLAKEREQAKELTLKAMSQTARAENELAVARQSRARLVALVKSLRVWKKKALVEAGMSIVNNLLLEQCDTELAESKDEIDLLIKERSDAKAERDQARADAAALVVILTRNVSDFKKVNYMLRESGYHGFDLAVKESEQALSEHGAPYLTAQEGE